MVIRTLSNFLLRCQVINLFDTVSTMQIQFVSNEDHLVVGSGQKTSVVTDDNKISPEDNASRSTPEPHNPVMMVISGGDGYIDFRIGMDMVGF